MPYLQPALLITGGLALIACGASGFVDGASALARRLRIPPVIAGLVVVGMATSAPELVVSVVASLAGHASMAVGNAVGSNIVNMAAVLGAVAVVRVITASPRVLRGEYQLMLVGTLIGALLIWDLRLARWEGLVMLAALAALIGLAVRRSRQDEPAAESGAAVGWARISLWLIGGLIVLLAGSELMVHASVRLARLLGMSELVIGLTIVAVGTSLPELAASIAAALKGQVDISLGNVLGSNLFNVLGIVGVCALLAPGPLDPSLAVRDLPLLIGISLLIGVLLRRPLGRRQGALLCAGFLAYQTALWLTADGAGP